MTINATRTLRMYGKIENASHVAVTLTITVTGASPEPLVTRSTEEVLESALQALADADGRTTWDENDICTALDCVRG